MKQLALIGANKLSLYLQDKVSSEIFDKYSYILIKDVNISQIKELEDNFQITSPLMEKLISVCDSNNVAITCLELAFLEYLFPSINEIFMLLFPNYKSGITLKLASDVAFNNDLDMDILSITDAFYKIRLILFPETLNSDARFIYFKADTTLVSLFSNSYFPCLDFEKYVSFYSQYSKNPTLTLWENSILEIANKVNTITECSIIYITGEKQSGKRSIIKDIAGICNHNILFVDFEKSLNFDNKDLILKYISIIIRDCFLLDCALCLYNVQANLLNIISTITEDYSILNFPLYLASENNFHFQSYTEKSIFHFNIPKLSFLQNLQLWNWFSDYYNINDKSYFQNVADKIIMPVGKIKSITQTISSNSKNITEHQLSEMCYKMLDDGRYEFAKRIKPQFSMNDIKLNSMQKDGINRICNHIKYRKNVFTDLGMDKFYPYGSCVSALFTGSPGTGKTMATHAIADFMNLEIFKVNLSKVVDKYIGETEKHLEKIFDTAEHGNMILFLDEADALIGKRNEIKDSKDKYSNIEVSYILQKIEEFDGIIIMATNFSQNIDPAFIRRIRYVVNFTLPTAEIRKEIWQSLFPPQLPTTNINLDFLSSDLFEFSGAVIKNIMLNAIFLAVSENSKLTMKHICQSIITEYTKMGRNSIPCELKQYL